MEAQLVKRVDHLIVRSPDPDALFTLFTQHLQLPAAWPISSNSIFRSGGVFLGNLNIDIRSFRSDGAANGHSRLYGIAFELQPFEQSLPELEQRGIVHTPPMPFFQVDEQGWQTTTWTNVFLGGLLGRSPTRRVFFNISQRTPKDIWERGSLPSSASRPYGLPYIFNRVFPRSLVYAVQYNPVWRAKNITEQATHTGLDVLRVFEVTVGLRDMEPARTAWKSLLTGFPQVAENVWQLPDDLHIHLVPHRTNELIGMVWQVASLNRAAQFLHRQGLLGKEEGSNVSIDPRPLQGLSIRLMA